MKNDLIDANNGYIKKSDAEAALWELRKKYRRSEEKCAVGGCILAIRELPTVYDIGAKLGGDGNG